MKNTHIICFAKTLIFLVFFIHDLKGENFSISRFTPMDGGSKFYTGLKGGINFSFVDVTNSFNSFVISLPSAGSETGKEYSPVWENIGYQAGFIILYKISDALSLSLQPGFMVHNFKYVNTHTWLLGNDGQLQIEHFQSQKLRYFEIPLLLKYEFGRNTWKPYIQGGPYYGYLQGADVSVSTIETMETSTGSFANETGTRAGPSDFQFIRSHIGIYGGMGILREFTNIAIFAEANLKLGFNNITNETNRFNSSHLGGETLDVPDDMRLNAIVINIGLLFPITKQRPRSKINCRL